MITIDNRILKAISRALPRGNPPTPEGTREYLKAFHFEPHEKGVVAFATDGYILCAALDPNGVCTEGATIPPTPEALEAIRSPWAMGAATFAEGTLRLLGLPPIECPAVPFADIRWRQTAPGNDLERGDVDIDPFLLSRVGAFFKDLSPAARATMRVNSLKRPVVLIGFEAPFECYALVMPFGGSVTHEGGYPF